MAWISFPTIRQNYRAHDGKLSIKKALFLFMSLFSVMTACTTISSPTPVSNPDKTIPFPRQEKTEGERAVMEGQTSGNLVLVNNCIRLVSQTGINHLLIWPPDYNVVVENEKIEILNGKGEIAAQVGDTVQVGGGEIPTLPMLAQSIQEQIPIQCSAPYWVVADILP